MKTYAQEKQLHATQNERAFYKIRKIVYVLGLVTMYPTVKKSYIFVTHQYIIDILKFYVLNISMG